MNGLFPHRQREEGQALVVTVIVLLVLVMLVGLAVDAGQLYSARRTMQEAADAGAYAGAVVLYQGGTQAQAVLAARSDVTKNGFTDGVGGATVTVNAPPLSGAYAANNAYVEVIVQAQVQTALVPSAGLTTVRVRGVAGAEPLNNRYAVMTLDRGNTPSAFSTSANADVHITGGGILVNSTSATAATNGQTNPARFTIQSPYGVDIAGSTGSSWPVPVSVGRPQLPDPFAGYPKPSTAGLPLCTALTSPGCQDAAGNQNPGVYTVSIGGAGGTRIVLNPGRYILEAGMNAGGNADITSRLDSSCESPPSTSVTATIGPGQQTITPAAMTSITVGTYIVVDAPGTANLEVVAVTATTATTFTATFTRSHSGTWPVNGNGTCGVFIYNTLKNYPGPYGPLDTCTGVTLSGNGASNLNAHTASWTPDPKNDPYLNFLLYQDPACTAAMTISGNGSFTGSGTVYLPAANFRFNGNPASLSGSQLIANTIDLQNGNLTIDFNGNNTAQPVLPRLSE